MPIKAIRKFIKLESSSGIILLITALLALLVSNSPLYIYYHQLFDLSLGLKAGPFRFEKNLTWWINEVLMVFFFLMVSLEIKWEMVKGELNSISRAMLPLIAAAGGMCVPALIYMLFNWNNPGVYAGWAIPTATDIAFSLGSLSLLGKRVPLSLKVFLSAIAIFDDLGAILIVAFFYTHKISLAPLLLGACLLLILWVLNYYRNIKLTPYFITGFLLWLCFLHAGIHPTLAGVITALAIPVHPLDEKQPSPISQLTHKLHPWVAFLILPLFAFANAGISFTSELTLSHLANPVVLGIAAGLFFGKQIGIWGATYLSVKFKLCQLPKQVSWPNLYGMALICGIGFTMSLFIGALAFSGAEKKSYEYLVRCGVMMGSFVSMAVGYCFLYFNLPHTDRVAS